MPEKSWNLLGSRDIRDYEIMRVREDRYRFEPTGAEADFVVCDSADWVLVIPITSDGQVIFIRQYRHGVRQVVLEIPGGIMESNESPEETAARELREETGFVATGIELAGALFPNPALNNAYCHIAVARGCARVAEPNLDPLERIEVEPRPLDSVPTMIRDGQLRHALAIAAFTLAGV